MQGFDSPATSSANSFVTIGSIGAPSIGTAATTVASSTKSKSRFTLKSKLTPLFRASSAATTSSSLTFSSLSTESSGTPTTGSFSTNGDKPKKIKSHGGGRRYVKTKAAASISPPNTPLPVSMPISPRVQSMEEAAPKPKVKVMGGGRRHVKTTVQPVQRVIVTEPVEKKYKTVGGGRRHVKPRRKDNVPEIHLETDPSPAPPSATVVKLHSPTALGLTENDPFASASPGAAPYLPTPPSTSPLTPSQILPSSIPTTSPRAANPEPLAPVRYAPPTPVESPIAGPSMSPPERVARPLPQPPRPPPIPMETRPSTSSTSSTSSYRTPVTPSTTLHRAPPTPSSPPSMLPYLSPESESDSMPQHPPIISRRRGYSEAQPRRVEEIPVQPLPQHRRPATLTSTGLMVARQSPMRSPSHRYRSPRDRYAFLPPPPPYSPRGSETREDTYAEELGYVEEQTRRLSTMSIVSSDSYYEESLIPLFPTPQPLPAVAPLRVRTSVDRRSVVAPPHHHHSRSPMVQRRESLVRTAQLPRRPRTAPQPTHEQLYMRSSVGDRDYRDVLDDILFSDEVEEESESSDDVILEEESDRDSDESDIDPMMSHRPGMRGERQRARHMERMALYSNGTLNRGGRGGRPDSDAW